ncbi:MAG: RHS repeat-associated core domain-containing protein, partial [Bacteroidales bacterium]|nr:RHS repeat-associated core domain-containing protein [Bacteroidales bacterium]
GDCWALYVDNSACIDSLFYLLTDNQGSVNMITNSSGGKLMEYNFDPWGRRRNPTDWSYNNVPAAYITTRGYTMHEHMDAFKLINMNGRVYDPVLGHFLSPDPYVQDPTVSQCFNRYGYCLFNPLKYVDPSGYLVNPGFKNDVWYSIERLWNSTHAGEDWMYTNGGGGNWYGQRISGLYDNGFTFYGGGGGRYYKKVESIPTRSFLGAILRFLGIGRDLGGFQRLVWNTNSHSILISDENGFSRNEDCKVLSLAPNRDDLTQKGNQGEIKRQSFLKALSIFYWKYKMMLPDAYSINVGLEAALTVTGMNYMPGLIVANNYSEKIQEKKFVNSNGGWTGGWDHSIGVSLTNYYYTGDLEDFSIQVFKGKWTSVSIGVLFLEAGFVYWPNQINGITVGWVFGVTGSIELSPNLVSGNITRGTTDW